ncbi:MAG: hypothetical protein JNL42_15225 [Anaerolineae bacterium]|nr:hypothetical protein [Anaerolineae bacterium]
MTLVELTIRLPQALADEAKQFDLLRDERIAALLEREILREEAWVRLSAMAEVVRESAAEKYGSLSDDEVMDLVNEEIKIMRAEDRAKAALQKPDEL